MACLDRGYISAIKKNIKTLTWTSCNQIATTASRARNVRYGVILNYTDNRSTRLIEPQYDEKNIQFHYKSYSSLIGVEFGVLIVPTSRGDRQFQEIRIEADNLLKTTIPIL